MKNRGSSFEMARDFGLAFPDVVEGTRYGSPAIMLGKRLIACIPVHRSAEPGSLAIRTDFDQREGFLADDPATYYVTDHYVNHPIVLVRLARIQADQLRELIAAARQFVLAGEKRKARKTAPGQGRQ